MSDFERELKRVKEEQKRQERADLKSNLERERKESLDYERSERERKEQARDEYRKYVQPVKPMVERLMHDLANETWGRGNYARSFGSSAEEYNEGKGNNYCSSPTIATWEVGVTETTKKRQFGVLVINGKEVGNPWKTKRRRTLEAGKGEDVYYYCVSLQRTDSEPLRFNVSGLGLTQGTNEQELRELLKMAFLKGPDKRSDRPYIGGGDSSHHTDGARGDGMG